MRKKFVYFWIGFLIFFYLCIPCRAQEFPFITVETSQFKKTIIRVPEFSGDPTEGKKAAALLRRLFNYHLFLIALKSPPLPGFRAKEYYLKGKVLKEEGMLTIQAELWNVLENRLIKIFKVYGKGPLEYLVYRLCDRVIKNISAYQGLAETKIVFVKRGGEKSSLYLIYFSKKHRFLIDRAPLVLFPKFSPSGKMLAYLVYKKGEYVLRIFNFKTKKKKSFSIKHISSAPVWSPDETGLFLTLSTGD